MEEGDIPEELGVKLGSVPNVINSPTDLPWYEVKADIYQVKMDSTMSGYYPTSLNYFFYGMKYVSELDVSPIHTDFTTSMNSAFANCDHLTTIFAGDGTTFNNEKLTYPKNDVFEGSLKLKGGNGTIFDALNIGGSRAVIDGTNGAKGYFTYGSTPSDKNRFSIVYDPADQGYPTINIPEDQVVYEAGESTRILVSTKQPHRTRSVVENLKCWRYEINGESRSVSPGGDLYPDISNPTIVLHAIWEPPYIYGINYDTTLPSDDVAGMPES